MLADNYRKVCVSSCLLGTNCKYNGGNNQNDALLSWLVGRQVLSVCPEVLGGLPTPRPSAEIVHGIVKNAVGVSVDHEFRAGANLAVDQVLKFAPDLVILQSRSPSCGIKQVYDGTFSGSKISGRGVFAEACAKKGLRLLDIEDFESFLAGKVSPKEYFDVCDTDGTPTGEIVERSVAHSMGIRHRTAHIWVTRKTDAGWQILLQKRSLNKESFPGRYDTSSAGHIDAGDEPIISALRELSEELGIRAEKEDLRFIRTFDISYDGEFHGKSFHDRETAFVFAYEREIDIEQLTLQKEELDSVRWFDIDEALATRKRNDPSFCVPSDGLAVIADDLKKR